MDAANPKSSQPENGGRAHAVQGQRSVVAYVYASAFRAFQMVLSLKPHFAGLLGPRLHQSAPNTVRFNGDVSQNDIRRASLYNDVPVRLTDAFGHGNGVLLIAHGRIAAPNHDQTCVVNVVIVAEHSRISIFAYNNERKIGGSLVIGFCRLIRIFREHRARRRLGQSTFQAI